MSNTTSIDIFVEPTPNPNALKFICPNAVTNRGKVSIKEPAQCLHVPLARELFELRGVDQLHFFEQVITVSKFSFEPWDELEGKVLKVLNEYLPAHDADFVIEGPAGSQQTVVDRSHLSPELQQIEEILDQKIRPGLQGDGGDLLCLSFEHPVLLIRYQGACGSCPSSTMGTLEAIRQILKDDFNPAIEVYIAPGE